MRRGSLDVSAGYSYASFIFRKPFAKLASTGYPLLPLKELLAVPLANGIFKTQDYYGEGVPLVNVYDLYRDTQIDFDTLERIQVDARELDRFKVEEGDVFFCRSSLKPEGVGWTSFVKELIEPAVYECHLIRARPEQSLVVPEFLSHYCRTTLARDYLIARASVTTMATIEQTAIQDLPVILPPCSTQHELVAEMQVARERRARQLADADRELAGIDAFLLDALGLTEPPADPRMMYAVRLKDCQTTRRLNADYFHPERINAIRAAEQHKQQGLRSPRLMDIVTFERNLTKADADATYLGLAGVQSNTGELTRTEETAEGTAFEFEPDDVLFARLRPYLNKVYRAEQKGVCSTEFHVLRMRSEQQCGYRVLPDYLAAVLRSSLTLAQTRHMMTGNTHPRLANEDVINLVVPIPNDTAVQEGVVDEVQRRRMAARGMREAATREWEQAKAAFERELLG